MKTIPETIVALIRMLEAGRERPFDLRPEDGPTIWPLLLEAAGNDSMAATAAMNKLESVNTPRGGFFLPWARRQSSGALICALGAALSELCECGSILPDPEDSSLCGECRLDGQIHSLESRRDDQ